jgi:hypothetical protein
MPRCHRRRAIRVVPSSAPAALTELTRGPFAGPRETNCTASRCLRFAPLRGFVPRSGLATKSDGRTAREIMDRLWRVREQLQHPKRRRPFVAASTFALDAQSFRFLSTEGEKPCRRSEGATDSPRASLRTTVRLGTLSPRSTCPTYVAVSSAASARSSWVHPRPVRSRRTVSPRIWPSRAFATLDK